VLPLPASAATASEVLSFEEENYFEREALFSDWPQPLSALHYQPAVRGQELRWHETVEASQRTGYLSVMRAMRLWQHELAASTQRMALVWIWLAIVAPRSLMLKPAPLDVSLISVIRKTYG